MRGDVAARRTRADDPSGEALDGATLLLVLALIVLAAAIVIRAVTRDGASDHLEGGGRDRGRQSTGFRRDFRSTDPGESGPVSTDRCSPIRPERRTPINSGLARAARSRGSTASPPPRQDHSCTPPRLRPPPAATCATSRSSRTSTTARPRWSTRCCGSPVRSASTSTSTSERWTPVTSSARRASRSSPRTPRCGTPVRPPVTGR